MKAAIFRELERPLSIEEVEIDRPGPHEVLIRTVASGVCHSDLHLPAWDVADQNTGDPRPRTGGYH
jgi:Zn-dependent alcohol dehydrogenase